MRLWSGLVFLGLIGLMGLATPSLGEGPKLVPSMAVWGGKAVLIEELVGNPKGDVANGQVEWKAGVDGTNRMTIEGIARFPPRTLRVDLRFALNSDASLPATHLFQVNFGYGPHFGDNRIAALRGIMLKDDATKPGTALSGTGVRVEGGRFLFALTPGDAELARNMTLLEERGFIDIAVSYDDGQRAIVTLAIGGAKKAFSDFSAVALK